MSNQTLPLIQHPRFEVAFKYIKQCMQCRHSMNSKLGFIVGEAGIGKTRLMQFVKSRYPVIKEDIADQIPVLAVRCPSRFSESTFFNAILCAIGAPQRPNATAAKLKIQVQELLLQHQVKLVLIDEIQDGIPQSGVRDRSQVVKSLKFLNDECPCAIVCLGIHTSRSLYDEESQIKSRCRSPFNMRHFDYQTKEDKDYWLSFLLGVFEDLNLPVSKELSFADLMMSATLGDLRTLERLIVDLNLNAPEKPETIDELLDKFNEVWEAYEYDPSRPSPFDLSGSGVSEGLALLPFNQLVQAH
ncbi:TniB family NTP-binding protein [Neptunicella sp. SCSIO 80796]|uniref:TniB family NTP-binding protein n=1 Tax=Neptunicella plasticusilytica TaxID=3117012 RepID=UPI003A4DD0B2